MNKNLTSLLLLSVVLFAGCAQQVTEHEQVAETVDDGLQLRESGLDTVATAFAFDMSGAKVFLNPIEIEYSKRFGRADSPFRSKDYELEARDLARLQTLMGSTFSERFLTARNSELVADQQQADYTLQLKLEKFSLGAPLSPSPWAWRVYTDQSAYGILSGELRDRDGNTVMRFRDRRDIGENFGNIGPNGRFERFTSVTFWADMRIDMRRAFASLDRTLE